MVSLATLQEEFGRVVPFLPASDPGALPLQWKRRQLRFLSAMASVFMSDNVPLALVRAGEVLLPESRFSIYPVASQGAPRWMLHNFSGEPSSSPVHNATSLPGVAWYRAHGKDPFANRVVNIPTLFAPQGTNQPNRLDQFDQAYARVFEPNGVHHQLRAVLYSSSGEAELFIGFYRHRGGQVFSLDEHILLQLVLPLFQDWFHVARNIGLHPVGDHALATALDTNAAPCWLLDGHRIVFANLAARRFPIVPLWVRHPAPGAPARRVALAPNGHPLTMVLGHERAVLAQSNSALDRLPPSLRDVARLAATGQSDKEIAEELGKPLSTVRTYLTRVYARLGIRGRRELMLC